MISKLILLPVATILTQSFVFAGGFVDTCSDFSYPNFSKDGEFTLSANCKNAAQQTVATSVDLYDCIANYNGQPYFAKDGWFGLSCQNVELVYAYIYGNNEWVLAMNCDTDDGEETNAVIALNPGISNQNGNLACDVFG